MNVTRARPWLDIGVVAAGCLIAWLVYFRPILAGPMDVPGDLGDARFNIFVLEHIFQWLRGDEVSLLSPGMFWPYPFTLGFSDTHAGTAWVYALLRTGGLDQYQSFAIWVVMGYFASFAAAYHVARKLDLEPLVAGAFAFAFAFSLPAINQIGHAQLAWRVAVPYCFLFTQRYAEGGAPRDLLAFVVAFSLQTLINVYLGVFAFIICVLLLAANAVARDGLVPRAWWQGLTASVGRFRRLSGQDWIWVGAATVAVAALALVMGFHAWVARLYGLGRSWSETGLMVPRPQSYLMMDFLSYWEPVSRSLPDVPVRFEHQIFLGIPLTILALAGLVYVLVRWRSSDLRLRSFGLAILLALVLFTTVGGYTVYWLAAQLPGVNSIRAVARYMLVLAFPVAMFSAFFVRDLSARCGQRWIAPAAALVLLAWLTFDLSSILKYGFSSADSRQLVERLIAAAPQGTQPLAYAVLPDDHWFLQAVDAALAAQAIGRSTLNGYSGSLPPGAPYMSYTCQDAQTMLAAYNGWAGPRGFPTTDALDTFPLGVNMGDCDLSKGAIDGLSATPGRPLKQRDAALVSLSDLRLAEGETPLATVRLTNGTAGTIHALSPHTLRLSWRADPAAGWDSRVGIGPDIAPGQSRDVSWLVPAGTRREDLSVTFVSEGAFWAHDLGIPPLSGAP